MTKESRASSTAVQVALRIRPLTDQDRAQPRFATLSEDDVLRVQDKTVHIVSQLNKSFQFDQVFRPSCSQEEIFSSVGEKLIRTFVEGYNVTILAYGQTSSGKTYTMGTEATGTAAASSEALSKHEGIVPRAVSLLFGLLDNPQIKVSFIEIYNDDLVDLLNPDPMLERPPVTIREDVKGQISLAGVKELSVKCAADVLHLLQQGTRNRATGATDMNEKSSRSHAILTLTLRQQQQQPQKTSVTVTSKLHFVDLAGSERLKRTAAQGDRRREGININAGLLALGNVISILTKQMPHVPYRDSKLTRLLQDSLGGNSQTLMIACVSPAESNLPETINTLQYASRARHIKNKTEQVAEWMTTDNIEMLRSMVADMLKNNNKSSPNQKSPEHQQHQHQQRHQHQQQQQQRGAVTVADFQRQVEDATCAATAQQQCQHRRTVTIEESRAGHFSDFQHFAEPVIEEYEKTMSSLESQLAMARAALHHADAELEEQQRVISQYEIVTEDQERRIVALEKELQKTYPPSPTSPSSAHHHHDDRIALYNQINRLQDNLRATQSQFEQRERAVEARAERLQEQLERVMQENTRLLQHSAAQRSDSMDQYMALHDQYSVLADRVKRALAKLKGLMSSSSASSHSAVLARHISDFTRQLDKHRSKIENEITRLEIEFDEYFQRRDSDKVAQVLQRARDGFESLTLVMVKLEEKVQQAEQALVAIADRPPAPTVQGDDLALKNHSVRS